MNVSFRTKLLASHAAVALAAGAVALTVVERAVSRRMASQVDRRLQGQAQAVAGWLHRAGHPNRLARRLAGVVGARVTIIDELGIALGDSRYEPGQLAGMDSEGSPPEVRAARRGEIGRNTRYSADARQDVRFVAVPAPQNAVVRLGLPIGEIDQTRTAIRQQLGGAALASLAVALLLAALVAGALTRRLRSASALARRIAAGESPGPLDPQSTDEVGVLSGTLATAAAELEQIEQRRRAFLANVAHEIRTPVTSIRGYAQTLATGDVDCERQHEFIQTIHRNAVRVSKLVEDLLELEALQAGKGRDLARDPVEIDAVVRLVVETLRARIAETGAHVDDQVPGGWTARADADALERILLNLMDNALRHGGPEVSITVSARKEADRIRVYVGDDGPGIPPQRQDRVFERFYRASEEGNAAETGSGLGLPIARELAQAMGGKLSLTSTSDRGTMFALELPAA